MIEAEIPMEIFRTLALMSIGSSNAGATLFEAAFHTSAHTL